MRVNSTFLKEPEKGNVMVVRMGGARSHRISMSNCRGFCDGGCVEFCGAEAGVGCFKRAASKSATHCFYRSNGRRKI